MQDFLKRIYHASPAKVHRKIKQAFKKRTKIDQHEYERMTAILDDSYFAKRDPLIQSLIEKIKNGDEINDVVSGFDAIPHPFEGDEAEYRRINYDGAINVFKCAVSAKIKKFIFASLGCVYGFWGGFVQPDELPLKEDNYIPTIAEGQTLYGYFKHEFEKYLQVNSPQNNIRSISLKN